MVWSVPDYRRVYRVALRVALKRDTFTSMKCNQRVVFLLASPSKMQPITHVYSIIFWILCLVLFYDVYIRNLFGVRNATQSCAVVFIFTKCNHPRHKCIRRLRHKFNPHPRMYSYDYTPQYSVHHFLCHLTPTPNAYNISKQHAKGRKPTTRTSSRECPLKLEIGAL